MRPGESLDFDRRRFGLVTISPSDSSQTEWGRRGGGIWGGGVSAQALNKWHGRAVIAVVIDSIDSVQGQICLSRFE